MEHFALCDEYQKRLRALGLGDETIRACMGMRFSPGEAIFQEGYPISCLSVFVHGRAKACTMSQDGKDLTFCYYVSDGLAGDIELMAGLDLATATLIAVTDLECLFIPYHIYWRDLRDNAQFNIQIGQALAQKVLQNSDSFKYAALYSGQARLCTYILNMSHRQVFDVSLTDAAESTGISYRHLLRLLSQLCGRGLLERRENGYIILDREGLLRCAGGDAARCSADNFPSVR